MALSLSVSEEGVGEGGLDFGLALAGFVRVFVGRGGFGGCGWGWGWGRGWGWGVLRRGDGVQAVGAEGGVGLVLDAGDAGAVVVDFAVAGGARVADEFGGVCAVFGAHDAREEKDALHNGETHECAGAEHQEQGGNSGVFAAVAGVVKGEADGEKRERQDFARPTCGMGVLFRHCNH